MIDVWFRDRKVGTLNMVPQPYSRTMIFREIVEDNGAKACGVRTIEIPLARMRQTISDLEMMRTALDPSEVQRAYQIPENARFYKEVATYSTVYDWTVLAPRTDEEMEFLFDHDNYEPV